VELNCPLDSLREPVLSDWFQQVIDGPCLEGLNRVLIEGRHDDDQRKVARLRQLPYHVKTTESWHLQIQEHKIGRQPSHGDKGGIAIFRFADDFDFADLFQFLAQNLPRNGFVIDNQGLESHRALSDSGTSHDRSRRGSR
jgi:hypothetical protein